MDPFAVFCLVSVLVSAIVTIIIYSLRKPKVDKMEILPPRRDDYVGSAFNAVRVIKELTSTLNRDKRISQVRDSFGFNKLIATGSNNKDQSQVDAENFIKTIKKEGTFNILVRVAEELDSGSLRRDTIHVYDGSEYNDINSNGLNSNGLNSNGAFFTVIDIPKDASSRNSAQLIDARKYLALYVDNKPIINFIVYGTGIVKIAAL